MAQTLQFRIGYADVRCLSHSVLYAVRALLHYHNVGRGSRDELCQECGLPVRMMGKILRALVAAGILASDKGSRGGYQLAREIDRISLLDVVRAIDGPTLVEPAWLRDVLGVVAVDTERRLARVKLAGLVH